jgi:MFS family permease
LTPLFVWLPVSVMRQFGDTPSQTGAALGTASILAALAGVLIATTLLPRLQRRLGDAMPMTVVISSCGVAVLTTLALLAATSALQVYVTVGLQMAFMMAAIMVFPTMLQDVAPAALRGRMASLLGVVTTVGSASGPPLVGAVSDQLASTGRTDALLLAVVALGALGFGTAGALFWSARRPFALAVAHARRLDAGAA